MHHSQQDQKNWVSQRKIQVFTISYSQETPAVATTVKARRTESSVRQTSRLGNHQGRAASLFRAGGRSELPFPFTLFS
jgi:hypothetical protein